MIIIAGTLDLDPERRDQALQGALPYIDGALSQPGCLAYRWSADPYLPGRVHVFEEWAHADALTQHFADHHYRDMLAYLGQFDISGANFHKYRVDARAPVYDQTGAASAHFPADA